jgi:hypothetical protein
MADKTKKVKIKLDQLLRIKKDLEDNIRKNENMMRKNNSRPKAEPPQIDFPEVKRLYGLQLNQLLNIKEAIRDGNANSTKDGETNDRDIYQLSNYNRQRVFLESLNSFEGERTTMTSNGKLVDFVAKLPYKEIEKELKELETKIRELETKLSDFNHVTEVTVVLYTELGLV